MGTSASGWASTASMWSVKLSTRTVPPLPACGPMVYVRSCKGGDAAERARSDVGNPAFLGTAAVKLQGKGAI
jgi:hypothetical protein